MLNRSLSLRPRRRHHYGAYACAVTSAVLLLLSVSLLYSRLSHSHPLLRRRSPSYDVVSLADPLISDDDDGASSSIVAEDKIDELDEDSPKDEELEDEDDQRSENRPRNSGYFYDHVTGSIRRAFNRRSIEDWDDDNVGFSLGMNVEDQSKAAFGSDDVPVDEVLRRKVGEVVGIEDALLLKLDGRVSPLREGWGDWFDKKSDFLRRDRMFKSNLEILNPMNNPMLQDPDGLGITTLTRGDRLMQKLLLNELKRKPLGTTLKSKVDENGEANAFRRGVQSKSEIKRAERRTLDKKVVNDNVDHKAQRKSEFSSHIYADGKRWGYYPALHQHLSFSDFMDEFFRKEKCDMRFFMVWNSPPWMYGVRYQRGLESLLNGHRDACVVVLSETIELDFFKDSFLKDGYKVAVAMPNLDELLKDTPTHIFTNAWFEWRKTKYYAAHYSELVRLAALYKYGGIYLDSDIIVLKSLSSLSNSVGMEDQVKGSSLNGAVMAFRRHSPFIMECLKEFYMTYDDTRLRWNGAELLSRVARKFSKTQKNSMGEPELKVHHSSIFFPISSQNISRYFAAPTTETEKAQQDALFRKILDESLTFHFWNSFTSALIPEPDSLVTRLVNHLCIRCSDVL
ncbi:hypothetical protein UlMin_045207 [Ulmus minor]